MQLDSILKDANRYRRDAATKWKAHDKMCRVYRRGHNWIGIPAVVASTIVGTTIFSGWADQSQDRLAVHIFVSVVAIAAVVLSSLQTFFNFPAIASQHKDAAAGYQALALELEHLIRTLALSPPSGEEVKAVLTQLHDTTTSLSKISKEAPPLRSGVYDRAAAQLRENPLFGDAADSPSGTQRLVDPS